MIANTLTLVPFGKQSFTIELLEDGKHLDITDKIIEYTAEKNSVFSDFSYEFILNRKDIAAVQDVHVYINDVYEFSTFDNGRICFP